MSILLTTWICLAAAGFAPQAERPIVRLDPEPESGRWRAVYSFPRPVEALRFDRKGAYHREAVWAVGTTGYEWTRGESGEQLLRRTGEHPAAAQIAFSFPVYDEALEKEYQLFQTFSDGSLAIFTGHFHAVGESPEQEREIAVRTIRVAPPPGGHVAARGSLSRESVDWTDPDGDDGTYLYLGSIEPIETDHLLALLDPGLPGWVLDRMGDQLPWYFETYTERFGLALPWKPTALLSFSGGDGPGYSSKGGTLTGLVQMDLRGEAWPDPTEDGEIQLAHLFAHEAAHLWNGQLVSYPASSQAWMHEGSADAFAYRLLHERGVIDGDRDRQRLETRMARCAEGLGEGSLNGAAERNQFRLYYECGEIAARWTELVIPEGGDLFSFWRELIRVAREGDGSYDQELYFSLLRELGASEESVFALRRFVSDSLDDPFGFLLRELPRAGWQVREKTGRPPEADRLDEARPVVQAVMIATCDGRYSFTTHPDGLRLNPIEGCPGFDRERILRSIAGHPLTTEGDLARRAAAAACAAEESLELGYADGESREIACTADVPPPPRRFEIAPETGGSRVQEDG